MSNIFSIASSAEQKKIKLSKETLRPLAEHLDWIDFLYSPDPELSEKAHAWLADIAMTINVADYDMHNHYADDDAFASLIERKEA
jgi:hypothetical protein